MTNPLREVVADALLPCPCGAACSSEEGPYPINREATLFRLDCEDEECGWAIIAPTAEQALIDWNRRATLPSQSAGVEERAREIVNELCDLGQEVNHRLDDDDLSDRLCTAIGRLAAALRTPASEGDGGRVVEWQIMRPAFVTADENYSGKRVAAVYADASMIGQRVRLIFDTTPPTQQEAREADDVLAVAVDIHAYALDEANCWDAERQKWIVYRSTLREWAQRLVPALQAGSPK